MNMDMLRTFGMTKEGFKNFYLRLAEKIMNEEQEKRNRNITDEDIAYLNKVVNAPDVNIFLQLI